MDLILLGTLLPNHRLKKEKRERAHPEVLAAGPTLFNILSIKNSYRGKGYFCLSP
jgi:hypothetical protein